jgi:hypothetical protein
MVDQLIIAPAGSSASFTIVMDAGKSPLQEVSDPDFRTD